MKKKIASLTLVLALCCSLLPATALATGSTLSVKRGESELTATNGSGFNAREYQISDNNAEITVTGSTSNGRIVVTGDNVTLNLIKLYMSF